MSVRTWLDAWYDHVARHDAAGLDALLHDDVVFVSPVVHTPQRGKLLTTLYLAAAEQVLGGPTFRYTGEWLSADGAVLEFETELDGVLVNGVDMIRWDDEGRIIHFKVMVRPLKAIQAVHGLMGAMLQQLGGKSAPSAA